MNRNSSSQSGSTPSTRSRTLLAALGFLLGAAMALGQSAEDLRLTVGKSVVIDYPSDIRQISTSSPDIVDASPVTTREILLHGKGLGNATHGVGRVFRRKRPDVFEQHGTHGCVVLDEATIVDERERIQKCT